MDEEKDKKSFKVLDRRRFDAVGNERDDEVKPVAPKPAAQPHQKETNAMNKPETPSTQSSDQTDEINFSSFVMSLATQSLMQLGEMKPPPGVEIAVDHEAARQTIDILRMLQKKTAGNLDASESKLVEEILHALRVSYVKATS